MSNRFLVGLCLTFLAAIPARGQQRIVVLGSSTAAGTGSSTPDSGWVNRLQRFYRRNTEPGNPDTIIFNRGTPTYTTYHIMPTGYVPPPGRPLPDVRLNVTQALTFNPHIIIINMPSNDTGNGFTDQEFLGNLRFLYKHITDAGVRAFITTTQPRSDFNATRRDDLRRLADSINQIFRNFAIDFWTDLVSTDGQNRIAAAVSAGDAVHINDLGHRLVFQRTVQKNIFSDFIPLPVVIKNLGARWRGLVAEISWQTATEEADTKFYIERSLDGFRFEKLHAVAGRFPQSGGRYQWDDANPAPGMNRYRLKITEGGNTRYTTTVSLQSKESTAIHSLRVMGSHSLVISFSLTQDQSVAVRLVGLSGQTVWSGVQQGRSGLNTLTIPVQDKKGAFVVHLVPNRTQEPMVKSVLVQEP